MQAGTLAGGVVRSTASRILVDGVERPHVSWSADGEIAGDLPAQVVAGAGVTQATGTIVWAASKDVSERSPNPWHAGKGWLPPKGAAVVIYAGDGTSEWVQFTGVIDKTTGSLGEGFQSTIIDAYDRLSAQVSHPALLAVMPPAAPGGSFRGVGLVHTYYVDLAFRAAGFFCTPQQEPSCVFHIPAQGGIWPHAGKLLTAGSYDGAASYPSNNFAPGRFAVSDFLATATPNTNRPASDAVQLSAMVSDAHAGLFYMRVAYGSTYLQLAVNATMQVTANIGTTAVASFKLSAGGVVQLLYKAGVVTLRASTGQQASGTGSITSSLTMGTVTVAGQAGARVSGMQISHPESAFQEFRSVGFVPTANINTSNVSLMGVNTAMPSVEPVRASDLLDEISKATLSAVWIDELGIIQWWPALAFHARTPSATLTTLDDIFSLDWEDNLLGSRSRVSIKYLEPSSKISRWQNVAVYEGSGAAMESGESSEEVVGPGPDEAWYGVDENPVRLSTSNWALYNSRRGSFMGGFFSSSGETVSDAGLTLSISFGKRGVSKYRFTHVAGTYPADVTANLATSPSSPSLWERNQDRGLPRLGAHGYTKWTDTEYSPPQVGGVGPELIHDTGHWVPADIVERVFSYLSGQTNVPKPTISGLGVAFDPRRQRGDVVTISSSRLMGVSMRAQIVGISTSVTRSEVRQDLTVRILEVSMTSQTYAELQSSLPAGNLTYAQWQALGPLPQTYAQFNAAT